MRTKHSIAKICFLSFGEYFVSVSLLSPIVIQKLWKKPHHYHVISSSGLHTKDKRGTHGAYCSVATPFGSSSATSALLTGCSPVKKQRTFTSVWFLSIFSSPGIPTAVMRAPYQVFLRVCFKIQHSWTAYCFFFCQMNFLPFYWTGCTSCNPDEDRSELKSKQLELIDENKRKKSFSTFDIFEM